MTKAIRKCTQVVLLVTETPESKESHSLQCQERSQGALLSKILPNLVPLVFYLIQCVQAEQESVDSSVCILLESIGIA